MTTTNQREVEELDYTPGKLDETAPPRIWLQVDTSANNDERDEPFPADLDGVTWQDEQIGGLEVEYVRADIAARTPGWRPISEAQDAARWRLWRDGSNPMNDSLRIQAADLYGDELDAIVDATLPPPPGEAE